MNERTIKFKAEITATKTNAEQVVVQLMRAKRQVEEDLLNETVGRLCSSVFNTKLRLILDYNLKTLDDCLKPIFLGQAGNG